MRAKVMSIAEFQASLNSKNNNYKIIDKQDFINMFNKAKEKLWNMHSDGQHSAKVVGLAYMFMNSETLMKAIPLRNAEASYCVASATPQSLSCINTTDNILTDFNKKIETIANFCEGVTWVIKNPWEALRIVLSGVVDLVEILALVVCAGAIIAAIFGHKEYLKYVTLSIVIYFLLKVLVVII